MLSVDNLSVGYNEAVAEDISFSLQSGDYLCIVGPNGSGKTTLMRTLLGLNKPIKGSVSADYKQTGYLPQNTLHRTFPASVKEVVLSGINKNFYTKIDKDLVANCLQKTNATDLIGKSFNTLSGGQRQRVLLARALTTGSKILFLDEPVSGLDPQAIKDMYELISSLNNSGITIMMITHDMNAIKYASHVLYLGNNVFFGTRHEFEKDNYERGENNG